MPSHLYAENPTLFHSEFDFSSSETELFAELYSEFSSKTHTENSYFLQRSNADAELARFLKTHKSVEKTSLKYGKYLQWRQKHKIDEILKHPPISLSVASVCFPHSFHGHTRGNLPIYIEKTGKILPSLISHLLTVEDVRDLHCYVIEVNLARSRALGNITEKYCNLLDFEGVTLKHRELVRYISVIAEIDQEYYPDTIDATFIVNAPRATPILWNFAKRLVSKDFMDKFVMIDANTCLEKFIEERYIPVEYGGECTCGGEWRLISSENFAVNTQNSLICVPFSCPVEYRQKMIAEEEKLSFLYENSQIRPGAKFALAFSLCEEYSIYYRSSCGFGSLDLTIYFSQESDTPIHTYLNQNEDVDFPHPTPVSTPESPMLTGEVFCIDMVENIDFPVIRSSQVNPQNTVWGILKSEYYGRGKVVFVWQNNTRFRMNRSVKYYITKANE